MFQVSMLGYGFRHYVIDLEVILVFDFYDVDAVPASLVSGVASAILSQNIFFRDVNDEDVWKIVLLSSWQHPRR